MTNFIFRQTTFLELDIGSQFIFPPTNSCNGSTLRNQPLMKKFNSGMYYSYKEDKYYDIDNVGCEVIEVV